MTCHDGFTLNDLVSYDAKHNEANGEDNRDGSDENLSWNCGVEGPTDDPAIERAARPAGQEPPRLRPAVARRADAARWATRCGGRRAATTTPTATTTRPRWFDWTGRRAARRRPPLHRRRSSASAGGLVDAARRARRTPASSTCCASASTRVERGPDRPARPGRRLAQHRADRPRRRPAPCTSSSTPTGSRSTSSCPTLETGMAVAGGGSSTRPRCAGRHRRATFARRRPVTGATYRAEPRSVVLLAGRRTAATALDAAGRDMSGAERKRMADAGPPGERLARGQPVVRVGPVPLRARLGLACARTTAPSGDAWNSFPHDHARSRAYRWNEDGMAGMTDVFNRLSLALVAVERQRPDPQGADVRADQRRGQPRRGRQGVLVVPRRRPEQRLAALALPLPAGRVPVRAT